MFKALVSFFVMTACVQSMDDSNMLEDNMSESTSMDAVVQLQDSFAFEKEIRVCGVNKHDHVYCAAQKNKVMGPWKRHTGTLTHVTIHGDHMFGVNKYDNIYYKRYDSNKWIRLQGKLKQIHFDGTTLCGANSQDHIYCATENLMVPGRPNWFKLQGALSYVVVKDRDLFGVNARDDIYRIKDYGALDSNIPSWTKLWGRLKTTSLDGKTMCGINVHEHMYCAPTEYEGTRPRWHRIEGKYLHVEVFGDQLFAIAENRDIYVSDYPQVSWTKVTGKLVQLSVSEGTSAPTSYNKDLCKD